MELNIKKDRNVSVVSTKGRLDAITSTEFEKKMTELMTGGDKFFVVDLTELEYISSAGLRVVLAAAKRAKTISGEVVISGLHGTVEEVINLTGFNNIFRIYKSADEASALLNK